MIQQTLTHILQENQALRSGENGRLTLEPRGIYAYPKHLALISALLAEKFVSENIEVVMSPEGRCEKLVPGVAQYLMTATNRELFIVDAEKMANGHYLIHPYNRQFVAGRRVLIIDDTCTVGSRARRVIETVHQVGGRVAGIGVVCDRAGRFDSAFADIPSRHALFSLVPQTADAVA